MRPSHILPSITVAILLAAALPAAAGAQDCFDYYGGEWPEARVLPIPSSDLSSTSFTLLDGLVAVVDSTSGLTVVDLASAAIVLNLPIPGYKSIVGHGRNVILHDVDRSQAQLVNLDNPAQPLLQLLTSSLDMGVTAAAISADRAVLVYRKQHFVVFDISGQDLGRANSLMMGVAAPAFVGEYLLLAGQSYFAGMAVIDCGPLGSDLRDWIPLPEDAVSLAVHGTFIYAATEEGGIHIIDIADPDLIVDLGSFAPAGQRVNLAVHNGVLYVNNGLAGLALYDLAIPAAPALIAAEPDLSFPEYRKGISVGTDGVLKFTENRLELLPVQCNSISAVGHGSRDLAVDVVPNPFNPSATISLALSAADVVTVEVYDLAGRHVRTLARDRAMEAGSRALVWDGRDGAGRPAASGVYLARVRSRAGSVEAKMALVR